MSTIPGVSSSGVDLQQVIAQMTRQREAQQSAQETAASSSTEPQAASGVQHHHHHHGNGMSGKIQSAVTDALQSAQASGDTDPNKVVEDAIVKVLQGRGAPGQPGVTNANGTGADGDKDDGAAGQTQASAQASHQAFTQFLQQYGITADQFRQDFLAAVKEVKNGQSGTGTALKSFPPGLDVDTTT